MVGITGGALGPVLAFPVGAGAATPPPVPPPPANPNPARVTVKVSDTRVSQPIPSGFVGFSFEFQAVRDYTGSNPRAINPVLVQLIRDVAPGQTPVLRIGGNSTDQTWWPTPEATQSPGVIYTLDKSWLATTRALAVATGAKLILGVNLKADSPAEAAAEAYAYRTGIGTRYIDALELGNEPELYKVFPYYEEDGMPVFARPPTYDFASYTDDVAQIAKGIRRLPLAGPATGGASWLARVPQLFAAEPHLKIVTYHRYPLLACFSQPGDQRYPRYRTCSSPTRRAICSRASATRSRSRTATARPSGSTSSTRSPARARQASVTRSRPRCGCSTRCSRWSGPELTASISTRSPMPPMSRSCSAAFTEGGSRRCVPSTTAC